MYKGRIIFGKLKRRIIELPEIKSTRPTTDAIKEAIFNCLIHRFQLNFSEQTVIDLFAGSGALGFEAASLGAKEVIFCEINYQACKIIKKNIINLGIENVSKIIKNDVRKIQFTTFKNLLVFLDPPYENTQLLTDQIDRFISLENINNLLLVVETPYLLDKYDINHVLNIGNKNVLFIRK